MVGDRWSIALTLLTGGLKCTESKIPLRVSSDSDTDYYIIMRKLIISVFSL
jgi:hypothetical protein